jgi:hypothetical protein
MTGSIPLLPLCVFVVWKETSPSFVTAVVICGTCACLSVRFCVLGLYRKELRKLGSQCDLILRLPSDVILDMVDEWAVCLCKSKLGVGICKIFRGIYNRNYTSTSYYGKQLNTCNC